MNTQNLMAQAQKMQRDITKKQEEIYNMNFIGSSEWVDITITGKKEIVKIDIKYDGNINDDRDLLADMITIALNDAFKKVEKEIDSKLGMYSKQLGGLF